MSSRTAHNQGSPTTHRLSGPSATLFPGPLDDRAELVLISDQDHPVWATAADQREPRLRQQQLGGFVDRDQIEGRPIAEVAVQPMASPADDELCVRLEVLDRTERFDAFTVPTQLPHRRFEPRSAYPLDDTTEELVDRMVGQRGDRDPQWLMSLRSALERRDEDPELTISQLEEVLSSRRPDALGHKLGLLLPTSPLASVGLQKLIHFIGCGQMERKDHVFINRGVLNVR